MTIKRYFANADNSITNAFREDLTTRGTGSNAGLANDRIAFTLDRPLFKSVTSSESIY